MADAGTRAADKAQAEMERKMRRIYRQAQREIIEKLNAHTQRMYALDEQKRADLAAGKITAQQYKDWLLGQQFTQKMWKQKVDSVATTLLTANQQANAIVEGEKRAVFGENATYAAYEMEHGMGRDLSFSVYDSATVTKLLKEDPELLPRRVVNGEKDKAWNRKKISAAVTQGIIQGESIPQIAQRIAKQTASSNMKAMTRYARTAMTSAQNAGRIEAMHHAQDMGIKVRKKWLATLDNRTRDAHAMLDGQEQDVDKPFQSQLGPIMYPGDPSAEAGNVYNCFVGETNVATDADIIRSYKHDYSGELITVKTAGGVKFTCTPNHPILTPSGWVAAKCLNNGDDLLIASIGEVYALRVNPHIDHTPSRIDAIHQFFDITGSKRTVCLGVNFHGDVPASDVEVITQKRFLRNNMDSGFADCVDKFLLKHTNESFAGKGAFMQHFRGVWLATLRFVGSFSKALSFFGRRVIHAVVHGFRPIARRDATVLQAQADNVAGDVQFLRKRLDGFTGKVFADNIVNIEITTVSHVPVYNLQTGNSRYFVNSITAQNGEKCNGNFAIAHNCRCTLLWVYPEYSSENAKRRDNETGKLIEAMSYAEWKIFKQQPNDDQEWNNAQKKRIESIIGQLEKQLDGWNDKTFSSYAASFSEYTKVEDRINALYKKRAELKYPDDDVMGSIKHIAEKHTVQQDIVKTNPNYRKGPEWWNNSQRCVPTYEMRRRGYDVEALPKILTGKDDAADKWQKIFDGAVWIDCNKSSGIQEVTKLMKDWGTGARAEVYIKYKRRNSAHVFVAENEEGNVVFRDPQSGQTVKAPWQALASSGHTKICRIDNLKPSKIVLDCMKEAK